MNGGRMPTGLDAVDWIRRGAELGAGEILLTSMDRDGTEDGYELALTRAASDAVEVPGYVDDLGAALRDAALFVLPSLQEGFGVVAAEALAAGVPVVATPSGGPEELLRASGGGVVLGGFSADELAETLFELLSDVDRLAAMRAAGREHVLREHSPQLFRERLAAAFHELDD